MKLSLPAQSIGILAVRYPLVTLILAFFAALLSISYTAVNLRLEPDRNALIRPGRKWNDRFEGYRDNFEGTKDFIVVVQGATPKKREQFVDNLTAALVRDPAVGSVYSKINRTKLSQSLLFLISNRKLIKLKEKLQLHQSTIASINETPSLETIFRTLDRRISQALVNNVVSSLFSSEDDATISLPTKKPFDLSFLIHLLGGLSSALELHETKTPWSSLLGLEMPSYLTAKGGRIHLLTIGSSPLGPHSLPDGQLLDRIQRHIQQLLPKYPDISSGITGQRAINVAELRATVRDTYQAGVVALIGISLTFMFCFHRIRHALLAVIALCFGIAWSAGALTLAVGHLTVLSVAFISILLGLGIDFGIHLVARLEEALHNSPSVKDGVIIAVRGSTPGNLAGALTTSFAFFGLTFSDFLGLAELGTIAGMGVLICLFAQLTVLPALLVLFGLKHQRPTSIKSTWHQLNQKYLPWDLSRELTMIGIFLALLGYLLLPRISYDGNILNLQADGVEAVKLEKLLIGDKNSSFAVTVAPTLEIVRNLSKSLQNLPEVSRVESIARFFPEDLSYRIKESKAIATLIPPLTPKTAPAVNLPNLKKVIKKLRFKLRSDKDDQWVPKERPRTDQLRLVRRNLQSLHQRLQEPLDTQTRKALNLYQSTVIHAFYSELDQLSVAANTPKAPKISDLPSAITTRLVGKDGQYLIRIYPSSNIWDDKHKEQFVKALRRVDPSVTGIPVQSYEAGQLMVNGYIKGGLYAFILVLLTLLVDLRNLFSLGCALIPLLVGGGWLLGNMWITNLSFNLANLIILPLMIGIGIDIGVHLQHRFLADNLSGIPLITSSTGKAVWTSALTTMIGFGSLALAQHQGIRSLGILLTMGVASNLLAATFVLAPGLRLFTTRTLTESEPPIH